MEDDFFSLTWNLCNNIHDEENWIDQERKYHTPFPPTMLGCPILFSGRCPPPAPPINFLRSRILTLEALARDFIAQLYKPGRSKWWRGKVVLSPLSHTDSDKSGQFRFAAFLRPFLFDCREAKDGGLSASGKFRIAFSFLYGCWGCFLFVSWRIWKQQSELTRHCCPLLNLGASIIRSSSI